jgi:uncharacterized protein YukE
VAVTDEVRVNPEALCHAGNELAGRGETLHALQRSCQGEAEAAQSGWVGSSAAALSGLLDGWASTSTVHIRCIGEHSCDMHFAAADFFFMERHNAQELRDVGAADDR